MPRDDLALAISVVGLWVVASPAGATSQRPASAMGALEQGVLSDINGFRRDHNLAPLRFSPKLAAAARSHSSEMAQRGYFSHDSANGSSFGQPHLALLPAQGRGITGRSARTCSGRRPTSTRRARSNMWLNSPQHRKNLLTARWREIGLSAVHVTSAPGTFAGREVTIVTADFGVKH